MSYVYLDTYILYSTLWFMNDFNYCNLKTFKKVIN